MTYKPCTRLIALAVQLLLLAGALVSAVNAKSALGGYQPDFEVALADVASKSLNVLDIFLDFEAAALGCCIGPEGGAANIATAKKLADDLRLASARSPFRSDGKLTPSAIREGREIISPDKLGNPNIPAGYGKFESPTFQSTSGNFRVHYYYNPTTKKVFYDLDYKVKFNNPPSPQ